MEELKELLVLGLKTLRRFLIFASETCSDIIGLLERTGEENK